jgi:hypothetical protein
MRPSVGTRSKLSGSAGAPGARVVLNTFGLNAIIAKSLAKQIATG